MPGYNFEDFLGKKVLIVGDVGSGKTALTLELLKQAVKRHNPAHISVIDMAPSKRVRDEIQVGGTLLPSKAFFRGIKYLRPRKVWAPRLDATTKYGVIRYARENANSLGKALDRYLYAPTPVLLINDVTMYLQSGSLAKLLKAIRAAETFIGNAYKGRFLSDDLGSGLTERERRLLQRVEKQMDIVLEL